MLKQKNMKQLSYDEFKQLAEHPQHRDVPAVFKLEVLETVELDEEKRSHYPKYKVRRFKGYLEKAEKKKIEYEMRDRRFRQAHDCSIYNKAQLEQSKMCGCFSCCEIFPPSDITDYLPDEPPTALCPYCHIDAVIGDASGFPITEEFLTEMMRRWFGE